jgi:hypothetical protein
MQRVTATSSNPDLLTTAFADATHSTLIVLNRSTTPQRLTVDWIGPKWTELERTSQTSANTTAPYHPDNLIIQPGEILTLSNFPAAN